MQLEELLGFPSQQNSHNTKQVKKLFITEDNQSNKLPAVMLKCSLLSSRHFLSSQLTNNSLCQVKRFKLIKGCVCEREGGGSKLK